MYTYQNIHLKIELLAKNISKLPYRNKFSNRMDNLMSKLLSF